jgi:hypothetical protein
VVKWLTFSDGKSEACFTSSLQILVKNVFRCQGFVAREKDCELGTIGDALWQKDIFDCMINVACRDSDDGDYSLVVVCCEDALVRPLLQFGFVCYLKVQQEVPAFLLVRTP